MRIRSIVVVFSAVVVCALVPRREARAQGVVAGELATAWSFPTQYLGIENFRCDCTFSSGSARGSRNLVFRSEPMVLGIVRGGPAQNILRRGDVITHIDGVSIMSTEGGRRFSSIEPGDDVDLTFKRGGRTMKASIQAYEPPKGVYVYTPEAPGSYSIGYEYPSTPVVPAVPAQPAAPGARSGSWSVVTPRPAMPPDAPAPPVAVAPGVWAAPSTPAAPVVAAIAATPRGWFGFSIRCNDCGWSLSRSDSYPVWESDDYPELSRVSVDGPAGRAGLQAGDRITHIDGHSLTSREGGRRFGAVEPGQRVRLTVRRGSSSFTREIRLLSRPEIRAAVAARAPLAPAPPSSRRELRYTGTIDNVSVEVWSAGGPSVQKVGDTMIITTGTSVVRIKVDPKK